MSETDEKQTIASLLAARSEAQPHADAIGAPGRDWLTYGALWHQIRRAGDELRALGIGRGDRVALVLPDGPELAVAWLAVSAHAISIPLNPAYTVNELASYLGRLRTKSVMVPSGAAPEARAVAEALGLSLIELEPATAAAAGVFALHSERSGAPAPAGNPEFDDVATVLLTAGTTARPRMVPLTHRNLLVRVQATADVLTRDDRVVNILPLFHVQGLQGTLLPSLVAGAGVVCTPGFDRDQLCDWLAEFQPTWYHSVPALYRVLLEEARRLPEVATEHRLRLLKTGGAPLTLELRTELETTFRVPLVDGYGLTEIGPVSFTPMPPAATKAGALGQLVAGVDVAIMDRAGTIRPPGQIGEIVARGPAVFGGYENDLEANADAFRDGWFHTGDEGSIDRDGFVFLSGRIKELINQGGEKIAPGEVDEALASHPAVAEAASFPMYDATLGEVVAAAVVLRPGHSASEAALRAHVATRLAPFKAPRRIAVVEALPISATGKVQRQELTALLARLDPEPTGAVTPRDGTERALARIWEELLDCGPVGVADDFFALGGNSLRAAQLVARIGATFGRHLPLIGVYQASTLQALATLVRDAEQPAVWRPLVPIQTTGRRVPLFCVHAADCEVLDFYALAQALGSDQPVYGLQPHGLDGILVPLEQVETMADAYIEEVRSVRPQGPYCLAGFSSGGLIAYEMARQLRASGQAVAALALFDTPAQHADPAAGRPLNYLGGLLRELDGLLREIGERLRYRLRRVERIGREDSIALLGVRAMTLARERVREVANLLAGDFEDKGPRPWYSPEEHRRDFLAAFGDLVAHWPEHRWRLLEAQVQAADAYRPHPYAGHILLFRCREQPPNAPPERTMGWKRLALGGGHGPDRARQPRHSDAAATRWRAGDSAGAAPAALRQ